MRAEQKENPEVTEEKVSLMNGVTKHHRTEEVACYLED